MVTINQLSDDIHTKVVGWTPEPLGWKVREQQKAKLYPFGLAGAEDNSEVVNLPLPPVGDYRKVMTEAVKRYGDPVRVKLDQLMKLSLKGVEFPKLPLTYSGWMSWGYSEDGLGWVKSKPPSGEIIVLDVENIQVGEALDDLDPNVKVPVCCVAIGLERIWVWLWDSSNLATTFPMGRDNVITGHNICYDRQFLDVEYLREPSGNVFVDTMSMWVPVHGMGNQHRAVYAMYEDDDSGYSPQWVKNTGTNGLDAVYHYYYGATLDKGVRDEIVNIGYSYVKANLLKVVLYCIEDVKATIAVFHKLYPEYCLAIPHPVSQTAPFFVGSYWLPLSVTRYPSYFHRVESMMKEELRCIAKTIASEVARLVEDYLGDYQSEVDDLKAANTKVKKEELHQLLQQSEWYRLLPKQLKCLDWTPIKPKGGVITIPQWLHKYNKDGFTLATRETAFVLGVRYKGYPVLWRGEGTEGRFYTEELGDVPNPEERGKRVTQLFTKNSLSLVKPDSDGNTVLSAEEEIQEVVTKLMGIVNWKSLRKRVYNIHSESPEGYPVFLPQVNLTTITRRCADRFSQVLPNPKPTRLGTGVKSLIEAPEGYKVVGGDISSQELTIASWLGDLEAPRNYRGLSRPFLGSCPLSMSVMTGTSATKTDVHSVMSIKLDMNRDDIKPLVYGGLYGQGKSGATSYLQECMPLWDEPKCVTVATQFTESFVGKQVSFGVFQGGLASEAFNYLHRVVNHEPAMRTPLLGCVASTSLTSAKKDFKTTKVNRLVQGSGADWRDALLLFTQYFLDYYQIDGRIALTIHDEIRLIIADRHVLQASYALNLAHLYTVAMFIDMLGLDLLPASKAWFECIDVTQHLIKEWNKPGKCPEFPEGLPTGQGITAKDLLTAIEVGTVKV